MAKTSDASNDSTKADRFQLWIDGCGGFLLLPGHRWTVGGPGSAGKRFEANHSAGDVAAPNVSAPDIVAIADWPSNAGELVRDEVDYWWEPVVGDPMFLGDEDTVPVPGSAKLLFRRPSRLTATGLLTLAAPHRFADHFDAVLLVDQTILIGPGSDCHIQTDQMESTAVIVRRQDGWEIKTVGSQSGERIEAGKRLLFAQEKSQPLAIMLDVA